MRLVRFLRVVLGVSQKQLAEKSKMSVRELARVEAGEVFPPREVLDRVHDALTEIVLERYRRAHQHQRRGV